MRGSKQFRGAPADSVVLGSSPKFDSPKRDQPRQSNLALLSLILLLFVWPILLWGCALATPPSSTMTIQTSTLPRAVEGQTYSQQLQVSGGIPPYRWSVVSGVLPPGISLSPSGLLSGVPSQVNTPPEKFQFEIEVQDSSKQATFLVVRTSMGGEG
jgi:hypothetical protein